MEWIHIKNGLPEPYDYVLVFSQKEESEPSPISIARHYLGMWEMMSNESESNAVACGDLTWGMDADEITHWMHLPRPPKDEYGLILMEIQKIIPPPLPPPVPLIDWPPIIFGD